MASAAFLLDFILFFSLTSRPYFFLEPREQNNLSRRAFQCTGCQCSQIHRGRPCGLCHTGLSDVFCTNSERAHACRTPTTKLHISVWVTTGLVPMVRNSSRLLSWWVKTITSSRLPLHSRCVSGVLQSPHNKIVTLEIGQNRLDANGVKFMAEALLV